jgi:hypothetical protein
MSCRSRVAVAVATLTVAAAAMTGSASAAVVSGSNLSVAPNAGTCIGPQPCTLTISTLPGATSAPGGARAAIDGVIVAWRVRAIGSEKPHTIALHLVRNNRDAGIGPEVPLPASPGVYEYAARMPVRVGDEIGVDLLTTTVFGGTPVSRINVPGATSHLWIPRLFPGEERAPHPTEGTESETVMNVTIEPDADHDGFGDETQDACPTVASTTGPCPKPPPPPNTKITKGPKGKIVAHKAKFKFKSEPAGATFQCKLDKKPFKPCKSPKTYKNLKAGKHRFKVRAVSASGTVDPSPAKRSFKVEA